ncbi:MULTISPECIES: SLC13 family permease [Brevibacterium]|uniref:Sodium-dependent dicarboxylate transporter SdcS n=1 Tax=Brevibacterium aurantiacum TaxID=273384 RepID=A0A556C950_BREAU|nr:MULTISPECIES: SLC13 family permease [Brevibacterium]MCF2585763.1 SLC13/DASS family transporter [Brevibacterium sp. UCMA 11752]TSI13900.1 SLC13/DASS family transporter [Brevibacterium aurantiacum]
MATAHSHLNAIWGSLWASHYEIKKILTFSNVRKPTGIQTMAMSSAAGGTSTTDRSDHIDEAGAAKAPDPIGPGYTPARLTGLFLGPLLFTLTLVFFKPDGLSSEAQAVLASTLWVATWWITEAIPIPATSLLPVVLFPLTRALDGDSVVAAYGNDIIFLFIGGFTLAIAMEKWNLHQRIALSIVAAIGTSPRRIVLGFMVATGFLSMWVSNTAATMMMIPVGLAVAYQAARSLRGGEYQDELPKFEKSIIFGIGYAATVGGLGTLIGTPPLAVLSATVGELFDETISFAQWMLFGVPIVVILLTLTWLYLTGVKFKVRFKQLPGGEELIRDEKAALGKMSSQEKTVLCVFIGVAFMWVTRSFIWEDLLPGISDGVIGIMGAIVLFTLPSRGTQEKRILRWEDSTKIPWGILLLFGGGLAIAAGFVDSGLSEWIGEQLRTLDGINIFLVIVISTALVLFLTEITSNAATATMILPVMAAFALALGIHPYALMVPCAMAANCAFMLPVGTPPNAIMFGTGKITILEMVRTGFWINILALAFIIAAVFLVLPWLWGIDLLSTPASYL